MSFKVRIVSRTWTKDNYNLFDYDLEKDLNVKDVTVKNEGVFTRKNDDTFFYTKGKKSDKFSDLTSLTSEDK